MINDLQISELLSRSGLSGSYKTTLLQGGGSDRLFIRVAFENNTVIIIYGSGHGADLLRWTQIQKFLHGLGVGVPKLFCFDETIPAVVIDDLGPMPPPEANQYPFIAEELAYIHFIATKNIEQCPTILNHPFDYNEFMQEGNYFATEYLSGMKKAPNETCEKFIFEFQGIASLLSSLPRSFCHRDFQSSNITISQGSLRVIDFQSAKYGPLHYDLASLLWDSRVDLGEKNRILALENYIGKAQELELPIEERFTDNLQYCSLSRVMQSLGAYSFLSNKKNKTEFLRLIPTAEKHLISLLNSTKLFEYLFEYIVDDQ